MAYDQALLESVQAGGPPVLRCYRWAPACLSLGRNQVVARREAVEMATAARGFELVRRATGGAAVLHDRELTYSVAVPVGVLGSPRETYLAINRALVAGLRRLGVAAEVAGSSGIAGGMPNWENPCFQAPAPGEVVVGGLKLVGSAQRREGRTLLQHGSLLLAGDQGVVAECLAGERSAVGDVVPSPASGFTTLAALLHPLPSWLELISAITAGFADTLGLTLRPSSLAPAERARITPLTAHFESPDWTWRR